MTQEELKFNREVVKAMRNGGNYLQQLFPGEEIEDLSDMEYTPEDYWNNIQAAYDGFNKAFDELRNTIKQAADYFHEGDAHKDFVKMNEAMVAAYNSEQFFDVRSMIFIKQLEGRDR